MYLILFWGDIICTFRDDNAVEGELLLIN